MKQINHRQFNEALDNLKQTRLPLTVKESMKREILGSSYLRTSSSVSVSPVGLKSKILAGISVGLFGFGSLAFASTYSVPQEWLYPIKTEFVEPLVGFTKVGREARAEYQIDLAQERIEELLEMEEEGDLDEHTQWVLVERFDDHVALAELLEGEQSVATMIEAEFELQSLFDALGRNMATADVAVSLASFGTQVDTAALEVVDLETQWGDELREMLLGIDSEIDFDEENNKTEESSDVEGVGEGALLQKDTSEVNIPRLESMRGAGELNIVEELSATTSGEAESENMIDVPVSPEIVPVRPRVKQIGL